MKGLRCFISLFAMTAWLAVGFLIAPSLSCAPVPVQLAPAPAPYTGVKKRIAVAKFDAVVISAAHFTGWDIGGGLAAQLTTALVESGRFVVVERAILSDILREQQLGAQRLVPKETAAQVGKLIGAQVLIVGSVTEFEQAEKGGSLGIGLGGRSMGLGLGGQAIEGHVGMDVRLVDTTTGQVLTSKRVEAKASATGVSLTVDTRDVTFGGDAFYKTPIGQAARQAIHEAVALIVREMEGVPWTGRVADLLGDRVLVNAGQDMNLRTGMVLVVSGVVKEVTDPATGVSLGVIEALLGEIQIEQVQEKFSVARLITGSLPKRGDLLRLKP